MADQTDQEKAASAAKANADQAALAKGAQEKAAQLAKEQLAKKQADDAKALAEAQANQAAAKAVAPNKPKSRNVVFVGCKLPHGLILQLHSREQGAEVYVPIGAQVKLRGSNQARIIGGYGVTSVDEEFMQAWMKQNETYAPVVNDLIFVMKTEQEVHDRSDEQSADVKTGLEPINQQSLPPKLEAGDNSLVG